jgi:hypothetical protein
VLNPQRPTVHALDARTGAILWQNDLETNADATFAPTSAIPEVVLTGSILSGNLRFYDTADGTKLGSIDVGSSLAAAPAIVDGLVLVGAGIGTRNGNPSDPSEITSRIPENLTALCVPGTAACAVDVPISGRRLRITDKASDPARRRFVVDSLDASIVAPQAGAPSDPTQVGVVLRLLNPATGEGQSIDLPRRAGEPAEHHREQEGIVIAIGDSKRARAGLPCSATAASTPSAGERKSASHSTNPRKAPWSSRSSWETKSSTAPASAATSGATPAPDKAEKQPSPQSIRRPLRGVRCRKWSGAFSAILLEPP